MKILYGIQGTGNGHLSRAEELIPAFQKYANVDVLISGNQSQLNTRLDFKYTLSGLTFVTGKKGGISIPATICNFSPKKFIQDVRNLPIENYDIIISDFEPVTAWSGRLKGKKVIELSHQAGVKHPNAPKPDRSFNLGRFILHNYCPSDHKYGFHFESFAPSIFTPVLRRKIRELDPKQGSFNLVYLPSSGDEEILKFLRNFDSEWKVFSKYTKAINRTSNVTFHPIDQQEFLRSLEKCNGVLCGAGFELPAEAIYLKKKLLVIPLAGQYEQFCNAEALKKIGYSSIDDLDLIHYRLVNNWLNARSTDGLFYEDNSDLIAQKVLGMSKDVVDPVDELNNDLILLSSF
ncbi:MAG: glycosyltransferase family protein [Flavobacteriales bacterium]